MVPVVPAWVGVAQRSVAVVDSRHAARKVGRERTGSWVTMRVETCANLVSVRSRGISSVVVEGDTWSRVALWCTLTKGTGRVRPRTSPVSRRVRGIIPRREMGTGIDASPVESHGRVLGLGFRVDGRVGTHRSRRPCATRGRSSSVPTPSARGSVARSQSGDERLTHPPKVPSKGNLLTIVTESLC